MFRIPARSFSIAGPVYDTIIGTVKLIPSSLGMRRLAGRNHPRAAGQTIRKRNDFLIKQSGSWVWPISLLRPVCGFMVWCKACRYRNAGGAELVDLSLDALAVGRDPRISVNHR